MARSKITFFSLTVIFLACLLARCDNKDPFEFPVVYLDVTINISTDPEFMVLAGAGNSIELTKHPNGDNSIGYDNNGIIVYNTGYDLDPYYAFDRTCPHDLPESIAVESNGNSATCPQCGSVYVFPSDGQPAIGSVSKYYLKKYKTYFNPNTGELRITN